MQNIIVVIFEIRQSLIHLENLCLFGIAVIAGLFMSRHFPSSQNTTQMNKSCLNETQKVPTLFQVADVDSVVVRWANADLLTHIVPIV